MRHYERTKRALYWTAVSLIVCEGLPFEQAARRMGIDGDSLRGILHRRHTVRLDRDETDFKTRPSNGDIGDRSVH